MASTAAVLNIMVAANTAPASAQLTALQAQLMKTNAQANATTGAVGGISKGGKMAAVGLGAAAVAAIGVGKALTASVGAARSFESSFAEVRKTVDTNEQGFKRIERGLRNLAKQIPVPVEELNNLAGEAGALGIAAKDIVTFTRVAAQLGTTTNLSSNDAANALARLSNIMGTSSSKFENLASTLVGLGNAGASTESEIADMALRIAATGKQVGLSEPQVLGFASALASVGINAEAGGSAISKAFSLISESVATGNEKLAGFADVANMSVPAFSKLFERNAAQGLLAFIDGLSQIRENGGNALVELEKLGINEIRLRNALLSAAGAGGLFNDQLRQAAEEFKNNSALSEEARKRYETFDSQVEILRNNIKDLAISVGLELLPALTTATKELTSAIQQLDGTSKKATTLGTVLKVLSQIVYGLIKIFEVLFRTMKRVIEGVIQIVKGFVQMFKGSFQIVTGLLSRDWRKAWNGAKNFAQGAMKAIWGAVKSITAPVRSVFQGVYEIIRDKFRNAARVVAGFVNTILEVVDAIPGVKVGRVSVSVRGNQFAEGSSRRGAPPGRPGGMQRGGVLMGGSPSGDSIPAMLERGEYVLNRKAVKKIGVQKLNQVNFQAAPRFQKGGRVGMIDGGDVVDAATKYIPGAGLAKQAVGAGLKAASWYLDKLPRANLPEPLSGMGPWLIDHVKSWIKKKVAAIAEASMSGNSSIGFIGPPPGMAQLANNAWVDQNTWTVAGFLARKFGLTISSNYRSPAHNAAVGGVPNSSHTRGTPSNPGAFDFVPASTAMQSYAGQRVAGITENLIHDVGSGLHNHIAFFRKGGFVGNINRRYPGIQAPNWGGYKLPRYVIAALAQAAGMPGRTMEQMTRGESLGRPGSWGIDPGGRSAGYGLWAITSPFNNDLAGKVGGYRNFLNPVLNAWAASKILARQGLGAWYGDKYVTGSNLNYTGNYDIRKALGGYGYLGALWKATGGRLGQKPKGRLGGGGKKEWPTGGVSPGTNRGSFLARNARRIAYISERISLAERKASADFGPGGSSLTQGEINEQIKLYERLLKFQMARRDGIKKLIKELKGKEGKSERVGELRGMLASLVGVTGKGGAIGDTRFRLRELGITSPDASAADSEVASLLRDQLAQTKRQLAIAEAQMPVFQQFMPRYHQGGIVQGPTGAERPVMAQAGEGIFTRDQMRAMGAGNITVVIEDAAIDSNRIRVEVDGVIQEKVSTVRRQGSNRRFATK